jgi:hypothetical protein
VALRAQEPTTSVRACSGRDATGRLARYRHFDSVLFIAIVAREALLGGSLCGRMKRISGAVGSTSWLCTHEGRAVEHGMCRGSCSGRLGCPKQGGRSG